LETKLNTQRLTLSFEAQQQLLPIIENIAKKREFSLVLDLTSSGVVYFNPAFDITDEVIKRYNAKK